MLSGEATNTNFIVFDLLRSGLEHTIYRTRGENANNYQGRIQDFKLGGAHFKKLRRAEGGVKIFGVFRVKNHHFTQKKSHLFQF